MIAFRRASAPRLQLERLRDLVREDPRARLGAFVLLVGLATALAMLLSPPATFTYQAGQVADRSVKAQRSVSFVSESLTEAERERAAAAVPKQYKRDPAVAVDAAGKVSSTIADVTRIRGEQTLTRDQKIVAMTRITGSDLSGPLATDAVDMSAAEWDAVAKATDRAVQDLYAQGLREEAVAQAVTDVVKAFPVTWTDRQKRVAAALVQQHVSANDLYDPAATVAAQGAARAAVAPVQVQVAAGEVVVREGSVVTPQDVEKLRALGLVDQGPDRALAVGLVGWAFLVAGVLALFIERYAEEAWADDNKLLLVGLSLTALVVATRVLVPAHTLAVYYVPYAAVAIMLTVLVGGRTALATQIAGALHVGILSGRVDLVAYVLVPALLGMAAIRRATTAREFVAGAFNVAGGSLGVIGAFLLVSRPTDVIGLLQLAIGAVSSGALSGLFAFGASVLLGHLFRITTVFELRELADPDHPLLRQLLLRTPGTYHHSLLVANLAERAAEVIGADPLTARVAAYYHDIGKMRNPLAFIENQTAGNPHDDLDPLVSAQIVSAHVRDGLVLAERYHLPEKIREVIPAHHGTSLIKYFWQTAQERGQKVDEASFRHPGPKPRSREAGIVMLADGVEAAVRSLEHKDAETISAMVDRIVEERVNDGQLDECDLTLRDIHRIRDAFCELLLGVYHERIPYPEDRIARIGDLHPPAASQ
ncbi:MAG: HDIG domain-containing protein [Chloroflexota bacterium]|nr:HDIG domain-containing protein [Chloroflexota bacterium]MDE3192878.1 HDIG domain-containing protein [Chloroflexota bacterium]